MFNRYVTCVIINAERHRKFSDNDTPNDFFTSRLIYRIFNETFIIASIKFSIFRDQFLLPGHYSICESDDRARLEGKRKEEWTKLNGWGGWDGDDRWLYDRGGWEVSSIRAVRSWASFCPGFLLRAERFKGPAYSQKRELTGFLRKSNIFNGIFLRFSASRSRVEEKKEKWERYHLLTRAIQISSQFLSSLVSTPKQFFLRTCTSVYDLNAFF